MELSQNYQNYHFVLEPEDFLALKNETRCAICLDIFEDPVTTFCGHSFCRKCLEEHIKSHGAKQSFCPLCKTPVGKRNFIADKKAAILSQIILNIKPIKKLIINETPQKDLLSTRKRKRSDIASLHKLYESKGTAGNEKMIMDTSGGIGGLQKQLFDKNKDKLETKVTNKPSNDKITLLVSNMPEEFQHEVDKFCRLYKAKQVKEDNHQLTHLVVFPMEQKDNKIIAKRTLKYLTALVEGLWVVAFNWIIHSNGYGELKNEEEFEVTGDNYGINTPRISRLQNGMRCLLENLSFYITEPTSKREQHISKKEFEELIRCAGGEVLQDCKKATAGEYFTIAIKQNGDKQENNNNKKNNVKVQIAGNNNNPKHSPNPLQPISHKWLLDSISKGRLLNYKTYV